MQSGLPGNKDESWKYTSLRRLQDLEPRIAAPTERADGKVTTRAVCSESGTKQRAYGFCWQAGHVQSLEGEAPPGVRLQRLDEVLAERESDLPLRLRPVLESLPLNGRNRAFAAMNTALLKDGLLIHVEAGVDAGTCRIEWKQDDASAATLHNVRVVVLLEKGARLHLMEKFQADSLAGSPERPSGQALNPQALNLLLQADLADDAELRHTRLQQTGKQHVLLTRSDVQQSARSTYVMSCFDLGGGLVRHETNCQLAGQGARADLSGAFVVDGERHVDHHLCVDHQAPACSSEQLFRGVLGDRGRGVFNGKAVIRKGADGSRVRQSSANLLLSDFAEIDTKPELEIYADEVEARRGATVGQLDEQAVFYLRSRGLTEAAARRMLTSAFCRVVSSRLPDTALAATIDALLDEAMPNMAGPGSEDS